MKKLRLFWCVCWSLFACGVARKVTVGVDILKSSNYELVKGKNLAVLANPTSLLSDLIHVVDDLAVNKKEEMKLILGPEHGFRGNLQAETGDPPFYIDDATGLPVASAYSLTEEELIAILSKYQINSILIDMQDVGVRLYTFIWTMYEVMTAFTKSASQRNIKPQLIIADRPNPNGGILVDGPMLNMSFASGYGRVPIPFLHGMTIGELGLYFNTFMNPPFPEIQIVKMIGWERVMNFYETDLPWVPPSPNLPTIFSALVYSATVFIEGTTVSEGRGTCTPFTIFGAPFYSSHRLAEELNTIFNCSTSLPCFRAAYYQPTFQKYNNTMIEGVQFVERPEWYRISQIVLRDFPSAIHLLKTLKSLAPSDGSFQWDGSWFGHPGTELIDEYAGTDQLRLMIDADIPTETIVETFQTERELWDRTTRQKFLLY